MENKLTNSAAQLYECCDFKDGKKSSSGWMPWGPIVQQLSECILHLKFTMFDETANEYLTVEDLYTTNPGEVLEQAAHGSGGVTSLGCLKTGQMWY